MVIPSEHMKLAVCVAEKNENRFILSPLNKSVNKRGYRGNVDDKENEVISCDTNLLVLMLD